MPQRDETQAIFDHMQASAKELGAQLVDAEWALDQAFTSKAIDESSLSELVMEIGRIESRLRAVHLEAHLRQTRILDDQRVAKYTVLRGYSSGGHEGHHQHHHSR